MLIHAKIIFSLQLFIDFDSKQEKNKKSAYEDNRNVSACNSANAKSSLTRPIISGGAETLT